MLVTGGNGKLALAYAAKYPCKSMSKTELDVTDLGSIKKAITPDITVILHTAAITSVEKCETDKKLTYDVNVNGTKNILKAIEGTDIKLIYVSTPCVFDGVSGNYTINSLPQPCNYYGLTKTISEELIQNSKANYLIIRTNFVAKEKWPYPKAFTDRFGTYLFADGVADGIHKHMNENGLIHLVGEKRMSMFELAKITSPDVLPMTIDDYHGTAKLTMDMTLVE